MPIRRLAACLIILLATFAAVSLAWGVHNALGRDNSQDFQYSGARALLAGENPYELHAQNPDAFQLAQDPNYLPLLYLVLTPIGALEWPLAKWIWAAANVLFASAIAYSIYAAQRHQSTPYALAGALIFLSSTEVRITIGNGQQSLLVTICVILALRSLRTQLLSGALFALALTKYSIGAFFVAMLPRLGLRAVLVWTITITLGAYAALWVITGTDFSVDGLLAPVRVASGITAMLFPFDWIRSTLGYPVVLAVSASGLALVSLAALFSRRSQPSDSNADNWRLATVATLAALACAPHASYDYVLLAVPFAVGLPFHLLGRGVQLGLLALIAYHWVGHKLLYVALPAVAPRSASSVLYLVDGMAWFMTASLLFAFLRDRTGPPSREQIGLASAA